MVQRKYLIVIFILLGNNAVASVWLPKTGKFKIHYSHDSLDSKSKNFATKVENTYIQEVQEFYKVVETLRPIYENRTTKRAEIFHRQFYKHLLLAANGEKIPYLITEQNQWENELINEQAKWQEDNNIPESVLDSMEDDLPKVEELDKTNIEQVIKLEEINFYKRIGQYRFWQYHYGNNFSLEYGIGHNKSIGFDLNYKHAKFLGKGESHHNLAIFSKFKIGEVKNQQFAFKAALIREEHHRRKPEYYTEWSLLTGRSGSLKGLKTFVDSFVSVATCVSANCQNQGWYSIGTTEGIKLPYGFMITNLNMYQTWLFENDITYFTYKYNSFRLHQIKKLEMFYEQISIAKSIKMPNLHKSEINFQLGYFFKQNLKYPQYPITGLVFSTWLEI